MKTRITSGLFSSRTDEWATPADTFAELDAEFHFNLDPCATAENHKCPRYFTKEDDGLAQNWGGVQCVLQSSLRPGHQGLGAQVQRGGKEARHARGARTDTAYFHDYIYHKAREVRFIRGRLHFNEAGPAPFPSMVVVF